ncbi:hypothetical protein FRACA_4110005 [Frankia canadensis]|uniref:Uncharacterized protein n=1 Tax=Frankia canadensis TaxID=1836972 RepID=A0A2I2KWZ1_9ACTN|nr:hypothetical protein [Frankia canadensis]SNQ50179.1 hypothetical protein FRACA_4110005 [Frankia canadensis]SOU57469.1 hypothetical protein FRACA_4110005 [Frankia canadensis]
MSEPHDLPLREIRVLDPDEELGGVEIVDEDPPEGWVRAAEAGLADYRAGRSVVCDEETFTRLLSGMPYDQAEAG